MKSCIRLFENKMGEGFELNLKTLIAIIFFVILIIYFMVTVGGEVISIRDIFIE